MSEPIAYTPLDPRQLTLMRVRGLITAALLTALAVAADLGPLREAPVPQWLVPGAVALLGIGAALLLPRRRYRAWGYMLDEDELHIKAGLLFRFRTVVPFGRVQHIDVSQGPLERRFGLGRITLHTAGTRTAAVWVPGLAYGEAERIRDLIRGKIRQDLV